MSHKRNEALRHVQHSMHHVIAAGEGSDRAPDSCKLCPYYRPDFKFRTCLYAHCPYKKQVNVFRSTPEKWDIVKATQQKDYNAVKRLQYLLTHSFYAKALAVKRVVTNDGRKTPGVDGVLWNTPAKKMKAVLLWKNSFFC